MSTAPAPEGPVAFVEKGVIAKLEAMVAGSK